MGKKSCGYYRISPPDVLRPTFSSLLLLLSLLCGVLWIIFILTFASSLKFLIFLTSQTLNLFFCGSGASFRHGCFNFFCNLFNRRGLKDRFQKKIKLMKGRYFEQKKWVKHHTSKNFTSGEASGAGSAAGASSAGAGAASGAG